jgi:hypothetical protein
MISRVIAPSATQTIASSNVRITTPGLSSFIDTNEITPHIGSNIQLIFPKRSLSTLEIRKNCDCNKIGRTAKDIE